ncbi:MAG: hypothetical protein K5853_07115 [Lachnospiraceae bacterium]|nr:hypothetical protein [Lachnospiraceae bacterium]
MAELRVVEGFSFSTEEEYQNALREQKAAAYLKKQMGGKSAKDILKVYQQLLDQDLFHTQVGYAFLYELNRALHRQSSLSDTDIPPIPTALKKPTAEKTKDPKDILVNSRLAVKVRTLRMLVMILLAVVVAMFGITLSGSTPTILDYETKLQDKYAAWEQDLSQREAALVKREAQLEQ